MRLSGADVYTKWSFQDFPAPSDEARMDRRQWTGGLGAYRDAAPGCDWRYLPLAQHAWAARTARNVRYAWPFAGANAAKALLKFGFSRCATPQRRPSRTPET